MEACEDTLEPSAEAGPDALVLSLSMTRGVPCQLMDPKGAQLSDTLDGKARFIKCRESGYSEDFLKNLMQNVRAACLVEPRCTKVWKRHRLKIWLP